MNAISNHSNSHEACSSNGFIYVLSNPAMPGLVKIGKTINIHDRLSHLDNTSVPLPFVMEYLAEVSDMNAVEVSLHTAFRSMRVRMNREFFRIEADEVKAILRLLQIKSFQDVVGATSMDSTSLPAPKFNQVSIKGSTYIINKYKKLSDESRRSQGDLLNLLLSKFGDKIVDNDVVQMMKDLNRPHLPQGQLTIKTDSDVIRKFKDMRQINRLSAILLIGVLTQSGYPHLFECTQDA